MADNTVTSKTSTVVAVSTDTIFSATYKSRNERIIMAVDYTKTSNNLAITIDVLNPSVHATNLFRMTKRIANASTSVYTITLSATGKYKIPLEKIPSETTIIANLTYAGSGTGEVTVINFLEG
jgi:predicted  nucleic acid-binding Zn-ribbon protein